MKLLVRENANLYNSPSMQVQCSGTGCVSAGSCEGGPYMRTLLLGLRGSMSPPECSMYDPLSATDRYSEPAVEKYVERREAAE